MVIRCILLFVAGVFFSVSLLLALPGVVEKRAVWDANLEEDLACYRLYYRAEIEIYSDDRCYIIPSGVEFYDLGDMPFNSILALTAIDSSGNESDFSEELVYYPFDQDAPGAPGGLRFERVQ